MFKEINNIRDIKIPETLIFDQGYIKNWIFTSK